MNKQQLFKLIDLVILFNVFVFIVSGIGALNQKSSIPASVLLFIFAFLNVGYLISVIIFRRKYNIEMLKKIVAEMEAEKELDPVERKLYHKTKQEVLEAMIEAEIKNKFPGVKTIRNAYVPRSDGNFSEIDVIVLCELGIFIIESKNITGKVVGSWKDEYLTIEHPNGSTYDMYNPIHQNTLHFKSLRSVLGSDTEIFRSLIVFGNSTHIESFQGVPAYARVAKIDTLEKNMKWLASQSSARLEQYKIESLYESLSKYTIADRTIIEQHKDRVDTFVDNKRT